MSRDPFSDFRNSAVEVRGHEISEAVTAEALRRKLEKEATSGDPATPAVTGVAPGPVICP